MTRLSIIIPTLNRSAVLRDTVGYVRRQRFGTFEMIIVDQSDEIGRSENEAFVRDLGDPRIRHLFVAEKNLPNARNEGLARSSGEIVLFLDDDVILLADDFLDAHVDAYADPAVGGVTGRTVERALRSNAKDTAMHVTWGGRTVINMMGHERRTIEGLKGANMSFRAACFAALGGFDRRFVGSAILEDVDFSYRAAKAGWRLLYEPHAELVHLSAPSGGVRVSDEIARECWRFQMTCYFILKHRGVTGFVPFAATFGLIGLTRIARWRKPGAAAALLAATRRGWASWRRGPDQTIVKLPSGEPMGGPGQTASRRMDVELIDAADGFRL